MNNEVEECRHYLENYYCYDNEFTNLIQINACGLTREGYHELHYKKCSDNPNCYFKQLLQLKAENDELEQRNDNLCLKVTELAIKNGHLTKKLEKVKEDLNTIFTTLEKANNSGLINDTIWVTDFMTLWDLIQQTLKEVHSNGFYQTKGIK